MPAGKETALALAMVGAPSCMAMLGSAFTGGTGMRPEVPRRVNEAQFENFGEVAIPSGRAASAAPVGISPLVLGIAALGASAAVAVRQRKPTSARKAPLRAEKAEAPPPPPPFDPAKQIGAMDPFGFFDPAGFSKVGDKNGFKDLRVAEIKHGRVAMMAALGAVAQHYIKFPGFETVPAGIGAVITPPGTFGFVALFALAGVLELAVWTQDPAKEAGDFGDPVGLGMYDEEMRAKEINNGRFAMFAALGIISADLLTGKDAIQQFGA